MEVALALATVAICVVAVTAIADRINITPPLLLIAAGVGLSFIPGAPEYQLSPELVLIGILPPLLYSAAYNTSFVDFRANRRALISLSVGLVIFTTVVVGFVAHYLIPGLPLAAGFAIGAIVAPPDAVAASAVARRVGMPRAIVSILEGESLVNDATALTLLKAAVVAVGATVTVAEVGLGFLVAALGGIVVGIVVAAIYSPIRKHIRNPSFDTVLSFTVPYLAYVAAEEIHFTEVIGGSGVIAVVVAGLIVGHKAPTLQSGAARLTAEENWRTVAFLLENAVFFLIGLQLVFVLQGLDDTQLGWQQITLACVGVFVAVGVARIVWVFGDGLLDRIGPHRAGHEPKPWSELAVVSWAGMRGVVTLAAALALPMDLPGRNVLVLIAFVVVVGSILIQGTSLPWLVRLLRLPPPDRAEDALQQAGLLEEATRAGLMRLDEITDESDPEEVLARLRARAEDRSNAAWERIARLDGLAETPIESYQRLRLEMLVAEREAVLQARDDGRTHDEVLRRVVRILDVEEAMLDRPEGEDGDSEKELVTPERVAQGCEHLQRAQSSTVTAETPGECPDCVAQGTTWVHLRMCLTCGRVGCCDSSVKRHATAHFQQTGHPVMRSIEPGEAWRWCYIDEILG